MVKREGGKVKREMGEREEMRGMDRLCLLYTMIVFTIYYDSVYSESINSNGDVQILAEITIHTHPSSSPHHHQIIPLPLPFSLSLPPLSLSLSLPSPYPTTHMEE